MSFEIKVKKLKGIPVLELTGRVVDVDAQKFSRKLKSLCGRDSARIVIDVSGTEFLDSNALGVIVYYDSLLKKDGRRLVILNANPDAAGYIRRLFTLTKLDKVIRTVTSFDEL